MGHAMRTVALMKPDDPPELNRRAPWILRQFSRRSSRLFLLPVHSGEDVTVSRGGWRIVKAVVLVSTR